MDKQHNKVLIICESNFYNNTMKVASAMQQVLKAKLVKPSELDTVNVKAYDIIGLGSGIKFGKHDEKLIKAVRTLPINGKKVFVFSTRCNPFLGKYHKCIKDILKQKNCILIGEFSTYGFDNTGPFAIIGGYHKGHPNQNDIKKAKKFAYNLNITARPIDWLGNKQILCKEENEQRNIYEGNVDGKKIVIHGNMV